MADGSPALTVPAAPPVPSGRVDLRPLTTSELIDRGFALYRAHFSGFLLLALLGQTAALITSQALLTVIDWVSAGGGLMERPGPDLTRSAVALAIWIVGQMIAFCFEVMITLYLADAYLGRVPTIKSSLRGMTRLIVASLQTSLLNLLLLGATLIFPIVAATGIYVYSVLHPPGQFFDVILFLAVALLILVASIAPVLIVFMRLMVTVPAVALEGLSGWKAVKRSSTLVRYDPGLGPLYWGEMRLSFLLLPLLVIELLALSLTSLPLTLHAINEFLRHGAVGRIASLPESARILSKILVLLSESLLLPLYLIATTLFYYDVRIRREGFDLEFMVGQLKETK